MLKYKLFSAMLLVVTGILVACGGSASSGPQTWIDQPLDNSTLPEAPLTVLAHASDVDGVASFDFLVDGKPVQTVRAAGTRLGDAAIEWSPPGPGTYSVQVRAVDANGNQGVVASKTIIISGSIMAAVLPVEENAATPTANQPTATLEVHEQLPDSDVTITAGKNSNCREGTGSVFEILGFLLKNQSAVIQGRDALNEWVLISAPDTQKACWLLASLGEIQGDINTVPIVATPVPPLPTATTEGTQPDPGQPPPDPGNPPPSSPDATPPDIQSATVSPASILAEGPGCTSYSRTTLVSVTATDDVGVSSVIASWSVGGESGQVNLASVGGNSYQGQIGPVNSTGTMTITVLVQDAAGNNAQTDVPSVDVQNCIN